MMISGKAVLLWWHYLFKLFQTKKRSYVFGIKKFLTATIIEELFHQHRQKRESLVLSRDESWSTSTGGLFLRGEGLQQHIKDYINSNIGKLKLENCGDDTKEPEGCAHGHETLIYYLSEDNHLEWVRQYHICNEVKAWIEFGSRIHLQSLLSPYSINLNSIESCWKLMYQHTTNNKYNPSFKGFTEGNKRFFQKNFPRKGWSWVVRLAETLEL